jgi:hypothetical protein
MEWNGGEKTTGQDNAAFGVGGRESVCILDSVAEDNNTSKY